MSHRSHLHNPGKKTSDLPKIFKRDYVSPDAVNHIKSLIESGHKVVIATRNHVQFVYEMLKTTKLLDTEISKIDIKPVGRYDSKAACLSEPLNSLTQFDGVTIYENNLSEQSEIRRYLITPTYLQDKVVLEDFTGVQKSLKGKTSLKFSRALLIK